MKRMLLVMTAVVCLCATASAQDQRPTTQSAERTVIMDISVVEVKADRIDELERIVREKGRLDSMIEQGIARPTASLQLRARSGQEASTRVGQRVPIQAAALPAQRGDQAHIVGAAIPTVQYENTGIVVNALPKILSGGQIEVSLRLELTALDQSTGSLTPTFLQRSLNDLVRVREGETAILLAVVQHAPLWPSAPQGSQVKDQPRGSFVVLMTAKLID